MPKWPLLIVFLIITIEVTTSQSIPPSLEAADCNAKVTPNELPRARFLRKGGRTTTSQIIFQHNILTANDVAQGRDLTRYGRLTVGSPKPMAVVQMKGNPAIPDARMFLWEHWRQHIPGYLIFTLSSVDATTTSHVFIEQDELGRWRISWRRVRHMGEIDDSPTYYSMRWVVPGGFWQRGTAIPADQAPDPVRNALEFNDKCGEPEGSL